MKLTRTVKQALAGLLFAFFTGAAQAAPITWYLMDVEFNDGVTATGSYVFDADAGIFSNINVITSGMGNNYSVVNPSSPGNAGFLALLTTDVGDLTGVPELTMELAAPMSNAGGTIEIVPDFLFSGGTGFGFEGPCGNAACTGLFPARGISSGFVTTQVPLPSTLAVLLLGTGLLLRRRRSAAA